jgi:DNA-binding NarL/FixJ family response regulator
MRILIVDDHEVVREGLVAALSSDANHEVVAVASTAEEGVRRAKQTLPDVALVDFRLPDMSGIDLCRRMRQNFPSMALVMLTSYLSEDTVRDAIQAGATGYVTKSAGLTELRRVLARIEDAPGDSRPVGASQIVEQLHRIAHANAGGAGPTPQQQRVLELAAEGLTNEQIGARLFISESTVRFHLQKLKAKLGARSKTELIARAIRKGLISPDE